MSVIFGLEKNPIFGNPRICRSLYSHRIAPSDLWEACRGTVVLQSTTPQFAQKLSASDRMLPQRGQNICLLLARQAQPRRCLGSAEPVHHRERGHARTSISNAG